MQTYIKIIKFPSYFHPQAENICMAHTNIYGKILIFASNKKDYKRTVSSLL